MKNGQNASFLIGANSPENLQLTWSGESVCAFSQRCPEKETDNEDAALVYKYSKSQTILAVADGAGGLPSGKQASQLAIRSLHDSLLEVHNDKEALLRSAIITGIDRGNTAIRELGVGAGTTMTVVTIESGLIRAFHVGDSGALVTGSRGKLKFQTIAHSPTGYAVASGMMEDDEALHHKDRHYVSNLLGTEDVRIEIGMSVPLATQDTLILASDGLTDNLTTDEIVETIRKGALSDAARKLHSLAQERMKSEATGIPSKPDDLTFVLYRPR